MSDNLNEGKVRSEGKGIIKLFFSKIKKIKHLDVILTVLFIAIILLIYFSTFSTTKTQISNNTNENSNVKTTNEINTNVLSSYTKEIEEKISSVISEIKDVGKVTVAVRLSGDINYVYAYTTKTETLENGTRVETKTPILITEDNKSSPLILQTIMPSVERILIVASGAKNTNVKLDILRAVELLYNLPSSKIEIFVGN